MTGPVFPADRPWLRRLVPYVVVAAVTTLALLRWFPPWHMDLRAPFNYSGDGLQHLMYTKGIVENGWYLHNPSLGAPGEMDLREFPAVDALPGVITRALGLFTHDPALVANLLFLLSFPLAALGAFFACRQMGISAGPAGLAGVLFAFLPYHFWRGTAHLYLSCYFVAGPAVLAAWWVATGRLLDRANGGGAGRLGLAAAICAVTATSGLYYPFFAGIILAAASVFALLRRRDWRSFAAGGGLTVLIVAGILLCLAPTLLYLRAHPHLAASRRAPGESEIYGLKLIQLLLPSEQHPLEVFRTAADNYRMAAPLVNENGSSSLGALGALGCLGLLGWLLFRPRTRTMPEEISLPGTPPRLGETLDALGVFNAVALLYGTVGGLGTLFSFFVSPQIRSVNRFSVFIAFFSLAAVAACLDRWCVRPDRPLAVRAAGWAGLAVLLALGLLDQAPRRPDIEGHRRTARVFRQDRDFFRQVQAAVPAGTMVFELPYEGFPEVRPVPDTLEVDTEFRPYVQTEGLRWSYGAIRDTPTDLWQQRVAAMPLPDEVRTLALSGFGGVLLERAGYPDHGAAAEATLRQLLGPPAAERPTELFFTMAGYTRALHAGMSDAQWQAASGDALYMAYARFGAGFTGPESRDGHRWYWCGPEARLVLTNGRRTVQRVRLSMDAQTGRSDPARLTLSGAGQSRTWTVGRALQP
ncbi:MAG: hypothetical protein INR65_17900, partial [Gluconacetobacter diazotrophicus]|nr:hypothetical protein [Gluconacetobacter diazotrophicus]